jgi:hypothetical protein
MIDPTLTDAIQFLTRKSETPPNVSAVVEALLTAEKQTRQSRVRYAYSSLVGQWQLGFITGTKRSRQQAGVLLGAGRFLPRWLTIQIIYRASATNPNQGTVENLVQLGPTALVVTGPTRFWPNSNILAFDFTRMHISLLKLTLYQGYIGDGQTKEALFDTQKLKDQAFFNYFLVNDQCIAARGRGGGLALWTKLCPE